MGLYGLLQGYLIFKAGGIYKTSGFKGLRNEIFEIRRAVPPLTARRNIAPSDEKQRKRYRQCMYNVTFEEPSSVKLINGIAMVSRPWQPQRAHVSGVGDKSEMLLKTYFSLRVKGPLLLYDFNQN
jgi:hypothetical protein